jgi:hypothetical protein
MKNMLVRALEDNAREYVDLVQGRLNWHLDETEGLWYVENSEDSIDMIAELGRLTTKEMLRLGVYNDYDPNEDYVNSNLETVSAEQLAQLYIDYIEDIWELLSDSDKEYIVNELTELTRNEDSISYYIVGPEEEIESLISIAEDIAVNRILVNYKEAINEEINGAEIMYEAGDGCLTVLKESGDKDKLMKVRKEVSEYATWIKYYYPNGEEELVYYKKN